MTLHHKTETIPKRLKYWSEQHPEEEAFVFVARNKTRIALTCFEILELSGDFGRRLTKLGIDKGSYICNLIPDSPEGMVAVFGIHFAGCILQNGTIHLSDAQFLLQNLNKTRCRVLIISSDSNDAANKILSPYFNEIKGNKVSSKTLPYLTHVIYTRQTGADEKVGFFWEEATKSKDDVEDVDIQGDDPAVTLISSGTTGPSKLILHSHVAILITGQAFVTQADITGCAMFDPHPTNWGWGLPYWYLETGCKRVMFDQRYTSMDDEYYSLVIDTIVRENCQYAKLSAYASLHIMELIQTKPLEGKEWPVQTIFISGQPLKKDILKIIDVITKNVIQMYGCSETLVISSKYITKVSEFRDFLTGTPAKGRHVKIVNEHMNPVNVGEYGQILIQSPSMFLRYVGDEDLMASIFTDDGYFCTKDYGCWTEEGELIVQGRYADVIMRGENYFHPSWIEGAIKPCPGVADVMVVKVPDEALLNEICACIVPEKGSSLNENNVKEVCQNKFVMHHSDEKTACPRYFLIFDSIAVNRNGKYDRRAMETLASEMLKTKH